MPTKGTVDVTDQRVEDSNPTMGEIKTDKRKGDVTVNENDDVAIRQIYGVTREEKVAVSAQKNLSHDLLYGVEDNPPWYLLIVFALQHCLLSIGGSVGAPLLIAANLCIFNDEIGDRAKAELVGTILFINGVSTLIQSTVGTRLPIMQGSSFAFFVPSVAILSLPQNLCPDPIFNSSNSSTVLYNDTDGSIVDGEELWKRRITELQGPFIVAALFELTIGLTGLVGWLTRFIGPLTIAPTISLIGFELIEVAPVHASHHWGIAFFTAGVLIITSEYMVNLKVPFPYYKRNHGCKVFRGKFFRIFPVTLAMGLGWLLSYILTVTNVLSSDRDHHEYLARTDASSTVIEQSPWFRFPYPGQWGLPKFAVAGMLAMCAGSLASVIESIGDYAGCAKLAGAPVLPPHAINRGIMIEGLGCLLAGTWGTGTGVTSYSENIAAIGVTRVGSRRVMQVAAVFFIVVGCLTKFGSVLTTIPDPVFGGVFMVVFGFIIAVGLSNLQHVDLNSHRNIFVLGSSLFMGLMISQSVKTGAIVISTGVVELDQTIQVLLSSALFVGGFLGMFFDNTLPGTDEERGMTSYRAQAPEKSDDEPTTKAERCYDLPFRTNFRFSRYIPILPEFRKSKKSASGKVNMGYNVEECDVQSSSDATSL